MRHNAQKLESVQLGQKLAILFYLFIHLLRPKAAYTSIKATHTQIKRKGAVNVNENISLKKILVKDNGGQ
jgi:hypothetical protein